MRLRHRTLDAVDIPSLPRAVVAAVTPDFRVALVTGLLAIVGLVVDGTLGGIHSASLHKRLFAAGGTVGFLVFSVVCIRSVASETYRMLKPRTGPSHAGVIRWVITMFGCAIVLLTALGLLQVPVGHLLLGGALTGVIVGIAAQQALGNVFAGVVLLMARPFNVGDAVRMRAGSLGGELAGVITGMGLTYVTIRTDDGPMSVPNSGVLAAVIGPLPQSHEPGPPPAYPEEAEPSVPPVAYPQDGVAPTASAEAAAAASGAAAPGEEKPSA